MRDWPSKAHTHMTQKKKHKTHAHIVVKYTVVKIAQGRCRLSHSILTCATDYLN